MLSNLHVPHRLDILDADDRAAKLNKLKNPIQCFLPHTSTANIATNGDSLQKKTFFCLYSC